MPTRNIVLTNHQEQFIASLLESGRYQNASEILREGLRMVEHRETSDAAKLEGLRVAARLGIEALDRGEFKEFANAAQLIEHFETLAEPFHASAESK